MGTMSVFTPCSPSAQLIVSTTLSKSTPPEAVPSVAMKVTSTAPFVPYLRSMLIVALVSPSVTKYRTSVNWTMPVGGAIDVTTTSSTNQPAPVPPPEVLRSRNAIWTACPPYKLKSSCGRLQTLLLPEYEGEIVIQFAVPTTRSPTLP